MDLQSTIQRVGVAVVVAMCMLLPGVTWAKEGPPENNPGRPFAELFAQMGILNDKLDELLAHGEGVDLQGVTQNWDKKLDSTNGDTTPGRKGCDSDRFTCIFGDTAVRDNETGIVWERLIVGGGNQYDSIRFCATHEIGGRLGWHLPTLEQLASLIDRNSTTNLSLPDGHPFLNVGRTNYWTATPNAENPAEVWAVALNGVVFTASGSGSANAFAWCARGGQSYDGQNLNAVFPPE